MNAEYICEECINEDIEEDANIVAVLKRLGCWTVLDRNGWPVWGNA